MLRLILELEKSQNNTHECIPLGSNGICLKPISSYLGLISKKWMIFIIMAFSSDATPMRYLEIKNKIIQDTSEKISDTTLSSRLKELRDNQILNREQFDEIPPRVQYQLTSKGKDLQSSLRPFIEWAIKDCHKP